MTQKTLSIILGLVIVGILSWYINQSYLKTQEKAGMKPSFFGTSNSVLNGQQDSTTSEKLVFANFSRFDDINAWIKDETKKLFTDADESQKIIKLSNLSKSGEVLAVFGSKGNTSGELYLINLATAKKELLRKNFNLPNQWVLSGDGQKIALVRFSNLEENYGYTIYIEEIAGNKINKIFQSQTAIKAISWDPTSSKIAFSYPNEEKIEIAVAEVSSNTTEGLKTFENQIIDSIYWEKDGLIFSSRLINEQKKGEINKLRMADKQIEKIVDFDGSGAYDLHLSLDSNYLSYMVSKSAESDGQIYILILNSLTKIPIQKGSQILGWMP